MLRNEKNNKTDKNSFKGFFLLLILLLKWSRLRNLTVPGRHTAQKWPQVGLTTAPFFENWHIAMV
jgi:hypothetical protein